MNDIVDGRTHTNGPMPPLPGTGWMVVCDFDGTISTEDVTDSLLQRFGRDGWRQLEERWERGEIGSLECMREQVALLDMDRPEFEAHLATIGIDPHFAGFVRRAREGGMPVQVASDGIDQAIRFLLERQGLGDLPVTANRLSSAGPRRWRLDSPWASPTCLRASGNCKCERLAEQRMRRFRVLFIGDGQSDFCAARRADFVLAKHRLADHCQEHRIPHAAFTDFSDALAWLPQSSAALGARDELVQQRHRLVDLGACDEQ